MGRRMAGWAGRFGRRSACSFRSYKGSWGYLALRLRQDPSPVALGFGSSNCSCRFSATCRPPSAPVSIQQFIFILIPALCHSQRVFWKVFSPLSAPTSLFVCTDQTLTCCCSCVGFAVPWACWQGTHRAGPKVPSEGECAST